MRIEFHNKLGELQSLEVSRVVVYDMLGNPVAFSLEHDNTIFSYTADCPEFNAMLRSLGVNKVVNVRDLKQTPLSEVRFE